MRIITLLCWAWCTALFAQEPSQQFAPIESLNDGVWLKGDLHLHSRHSDDSSNNPLSKIIGLAEAVAMDFLGITDHDNHVLGDVAGHTWADPQFQSDSVLLFYGAEWTTHRGHGNTFAARPYDHQSFYDLRDARDINIARRKSELGIHLSANHPSGGDPFGFSYDMIDSIEVWNSARWTRNADAFIVWDDMLKSGRMITGRGGSDSHHGNPDRPELESRNSWQRPVNYVGTPTTWVYANERSAAATIAGLTTGRVAVSANPNAPRAVFRADTNADGSMDIMMGDNVPAPSTPVQFTITLEGQTEPGAEYTARITKDGFEWQVLRVTAEAGKPTLIEFSDSPSQSERSYYRAVVEGPIPDYPEVPGAAEISAPVVSITNPLYFNFDESF